MNLKELNEPRTDADPQKSTDKPADKDAESLATKKTPGSHGHEAYWLWVMCLTGVDYFSTLAYQPSIAFKSAGRLAPLATIVLVIVTLFGALPIYSYVARRSPHGQGSIAMLEKLFSGWWGKLTVLFLLGFAATDFVITKTLSAADAAEHLIHNPLWKTAPAWLHSQMGITMGLLVLLGAMFLRGFREVIYIAIALVGIYLTLNVVIIGSSMAYALSHPSLITDWQTALSTGDWQVHDVPLTGRSLATMIAVSLLIFPKLALGLSGFETGVAVMPLVAGNPNDAHDEPEGRIRNTQKLLATAAIIMSVLLLASSFVTATLIEPAALHVDEENPEQNGKAANRALAFLAHGESKHKISPFFGETFGTIYDMSTVAILWFAGASAMSGLLNLVPKYLPRYGMAPEWASAIRPLVILFTGVNLFVTYIFKADVNAQGGAYATGVLMLMASGSIASLVDVWRRSKGAWHERLSVPFLLISIIFVYTTAANVIEKPDGIKIASFFIAAVIVSSLASRFMRSTELRLEGIDFVDQQSRFLWDSLKHLEIPVLVPHRPGRRPLASKEEDIRRTHRLAEGTPIVYIEATAEDASEFYHTPLMEVICNEGRFVLRVTRCASVAHVIAAVALELTSDGPPPEIHFGWSDEPPLIATLRFLLFGEGNVPLLVRDLIRKAQPDPSRQPRTVIG